jgi:hypothetical protein
MLPVDSWIRGEPCQCAHPNYTHVLLRHQFVVSCITICHIFLSSCLLLLCNSCRSCQVCRLWGSEKNDSSVSRRPRAGDRDGTLAAIKQILHLPLLPPAVDKHRQAKPLRCRRRRDLSYPVLGFSWEEAPGGGAPRRWWRTRPTAARVTRGPWAAGSGASIGGGALALVGAQLGEAMQRRRG